MKLFECQNCGQPLYFENTSCESCGLRLGYLPQQETVSAPLKLRLPLTTRSEDENGLAFDFLSPPEDASAPGPMTGHAGGLITLNVAEADDIERERQRKSMREPYRTLLGHFRHEIAHYYWDHLVANSPALAEFRNLFGDERENYQAALQRYYTDGPAPDWSERSSPPMRARIRGKISRKPGRTISIWSTRWKPRAHSGCACGHG